MYSFFTSPPIFWTCDLQQCETAFYRNKTMKLKTAFLKHAGDAPKFDPYNMCEHFLNIWIHIVK